MNSKLPRYDVVLIGAGHTNAHVLRMWRMQAPPAARLTVVSDFAIATYSGMLPGTLAGLYERERMQIDLVRLCAASGARLIRGDVTGLDLRRQRVLLADRPDVPFDVLSIGIGSRPALPPDGEFDETLLTIKPMQTFLDRLDSRLAELGSRAAAATRRIAIVGAGAGGVEIAFCLPAHLRRVAPQDRFEISLVDAAPEILSGTDAGMIRLVRRELEKRGVELRLGDAVAGARDGQLTFAAGARAACDLAIWATGAVAPPVLSKLGLPTDEKGFLLTRATLQTVADAPIFVVGDAGTSAERPTPKAGVYAVRQGPILWNNVRSALRRAPLAEYAPQRGFLRLLATGDGRAILAYKGRSFHAGWCWRLKDFIDSRFMAKYQDYEPAMMADESQVDPAAPMQCAGCGAKLGGAVLGRALERLQIPPVEHVPVGLDRPDDAAIVEVGRGTVATTVDFFTPFVDDPFLVGRVAALNAASDLFAVGSRPVAALALLAVEPGPEPQQEQYVYDLLAGAQHEFQSMGATLAGGHTIESPRPLVGFSLVAAASDSPALKGGLRPGDQLVLTKPLGSGVLLAAHMRAACRADWYVALERALLASNQPAADAARELGLAAITDVTGFGLAGHLLEMLAASHVSAELYLADLPLLPGARTLLEADIESSLAPANRHVEARIDVDGESRGTAAYRMLFDPQTSGGLLLGVPRGDLDRLLDALRERQCAAVVVGCATESTEQPRLRVLPQRPSGTA